MVEFALALPLFLLLTAGLIQFAQTYFAYTLLLQATQEGARCGAVLHKTDTQITACVQAVAPGGTADPVSIATTVSATNSTPVASSARETGNVLTVTATHAQPLFIPFFSARTLTLRSTTSLVVE
ncbi:MAG TPA: TadE/TadG family type IV pilus assembly protein [Chloroflexota bacterium]|nr:TadE/TadG family type IV pilus assembly protein [Chloroflexota bacterium]